MKTNSARFVGLFFGLCGLAAASGCGVPLPELGETAARCGDGAVQGLEACDDGNEINTDGCTVQCAPMVLVAPTKTARKMTAPAGCLTAPAKATTGHAIAPCDLGPKPTAYEAAGPIYLLQHM